jgi:glycerol-3-phosphate O-acyltransferase
MSQGPPDPAFRGRDLRVAFPVPSVRWYLRRRLEHAVAQLNQRLERPIQPFKLARRMDTVRRLIYDPEVAKAIAEHARDKKVREDVAFQTAERYAREIVPGFSAFTYFSFAIRAARFLSQSLYRVRLVQPNEDALAAIPEDATVIFVMNHRSNMDYVLVTWLAAERSALAYAVGEWARVWPLRTLVRAMGGYFIRRRYNNPLYRKVLARYVQMATEAGVTQAVFPEGGLSRTGALGKPKLGLISYILDGFRPGQSRDVVFVPVAINYDRVMEDRNLIEAQASGARAFRFSIRPIYRYLRRQTWLRLTGKFHRYGYAAVCFGDPLSLTEFLGSQPRPDQPPSRHNISTTPMSPEKDLYETEARSPRWARCAEEDVRLGDPPRTPRRTRQGLPGGGCRHLGPSTATRCWCS